MLPHMAAGTEGHEVFERIISQVAALDLVVDLQVLKRPALLASPLISLENPLHQAPVNLLPQ